MTRLPSLQKAELGDDAMEIWERITRIPNLDVHAVDGGPSGPFNAYLHAPEVGSRLAELGGVLLSKSSVPRRMLELMVITIGAHWKAEYEWYAHAQMARENGLPKEVIDAIGAGREPRF